MSHKGPYRAIFFINVSNHVFEDNSIQRFACTKTVCRSVKSQDFVPFFHQRLDITIKFCHRGIKSMNDQYFSVTATIPAITCYRFSIMFELKFVSLLKDIWQRSFIPELGSSKQ